MLRTRLKNNTIIIAIKISFILKKRSIVKLFNSNEAIAYGDKRWEFSVHISFGVLTTWAYM